MPYIFKNSGIDGAGFQNVIAIDPFNSDNIVLGGDVAGFHVSNARGGAFRTSNKGLVALANLKIASIAYSELTPNKIYAAIGQRGANGGFVKSTDGGLNWEIVSTVPQFGAGNTGSGFPLPNPHPRSTGKLIAQDSDNELLYVGTFDQGVMRSDDDGETWTIIGLGGGSIYIRTLVIDPDNSDILYVGTYGDKAYRITDASGVTPVVEQLTNAPDNVEELTFVGSMLFAACNSDGLFRVTSDGDVWTAINSGIDLTKSKWQSIIGHVGENSGEDVLYAGCAFPLKTLLSPGNAVASSIMKSLNSGETWVPITLDPSKIYTNVIGSDGLPSNKQWWLPITTPSVLLGRITYVASQIAIDPDDDNVIYTCGRGGAWRSDNGGDTWYPAVQGLAVTINRKITVDPNLLRRIWVANTDWVSIKSSDRLTNVSQDKPGPNIGFDIDIDEETSRVYSAFGHRDLNQNGKIFSKLYEDTKWKNEKLDSPPGSLILYDTFTRDITGGWGTPDDGPAYTISGASAPAFSTESTPGVGHIQLGTGGQTFIANSELDLENVTGTVEMSWDTLSEGGAAQGEITLRNLANNTFYGFRIRNLTDGTISFIARKVIDGTSTTIVTKVSIIPDYTPGERILARFNCTGLNPTKLQGSIWREGDDEPELWDIDAEDSEEILQTSGYVTVRISADSDYTSAAKYSVHLLDITQILEGGTEGKRPYGLAVGRDASNELVIVTALEEGGIWRKYQDTWSQVGIPAMTGEQNTKHSPMIWIPGSSDIYLYDRSIGIYKSGDYGLSWTLIWEHPSDQEMTGFIAMSPTDLDTLWVSSGDGLFKLTNVSNDGLGPSNLTAENDDLLMTEDGDFLTDEVTSDPSITTISDIPRPSAICAQDNGFIYCASRRGSSVDEEPGLFVSKDDGDTWEDLADDKYKSVAGFPFNIAAGANGNVYIALNGNGVLVGINATDSVKVREGSEWIEGLVKVWNGSEWDTGTVKSWDGSEWFPV